MSLSMVSLQDSAACCNRNISSDELSTLQENLVKATLAVWRRNAPCHCEADVLLKAHALSLGHSGVQVITVQRIIDWVQ